MSDFVKGKKKFDYPAEIQQGIVLHRMIDQFTDQHEVTRQAKEIFRPAYRLYAGAFVDVAYDHYLAMDENEFGPGELLAFSKKVYASMDQYLDWLPPYFAGIYPYMKSQNWLFNYREPAGIKKSFGGLVRRALYLKESDTAAELFDRHYQRLGELYRLFWKDLKPFAKTSCEELLGKTSPQDAARKDQTK